MLFRTLRLTALAAIAAAAFAAAPAHAGQTVAYSGDATAGTIVVDTGERALYLVTGQGQAIKYPVGVGRSGQQWFGATRIVSKHIKPAWKPPASIRGNRSPDFYIESGSPKNPMGAAALVLRDNELAIHGTNNPGSIGGFVSAGCIRMHNKDIMDLFGRVSVGTRVVFPRVAVAHRPPAVSAIPAGIRYGATSGLRTLTPGVRKCAHGPPAIRCVAARVHLRGTAERGAP